jgi:serine protease AprX
MTARPAVTRPSKRVKLVLSVWLGAVALACAFAPDRAEAAAFVPGPLLEEARANPAASFDVIVVGEARSGRTLKGEVGSALGTLRREYALFRGVATELKGAQLVALAQRDGIAGITPDGPVAPASAETAWPQAINVDSLWSAAGAPAADAPAIAVIDSGVELGRTADFGSRLVASVNLNAREPDATGDDSGHGTLVAGLAAGASPAYPGVSPGSRIVSLDVVDRDGMAMTSDVIAAADWVFRHRDEYGIRVANFSLHSGFANYGLRDPLSIAARRLWLTGTVVVAAAGNAGPQRMLYAPASDPFVITVGATDVRGTATVSDDVNAPWSSYGATAEGFGKPELAAPGRYLAGPVPAGSTLPTTVPDRILAPGYMWMSGTSFAAPIVSGAAALLLARHPDWTPDQVKGALMLTAQAVPSAVAGSVGVGQIDAAAAAAVTSPPNPNENLYAFVGPDAAGEPVFDADAWNAHVATDSSWTSSSWTSSSWTSSSWTSSSWTSSSWTSSSWTSSSWTSSSWTSSSWTSSSWTSSSWTSSSWTSSLLAA